MQVRNELNSLVKTVCTAHTQPVIMTVNKRIYSTKNMNLECRSIQTTLESLFEDPDMPTRPRTFRHGKERTLSWSHEKIRDTEGVAIT
jgi:hypothetical protein